MAGGSSEQGLIAFQKQRRLLF